MHCRLPLQTTELAHCLETAVVHGQRRNRLEANREWEPQNDVSFVVDLSWRVGRWPNCITERQDEWLYVDRRLRESGKYGSLWSGLTPIPLYCRKLVWLNHRWCKWVFFELWLVHCAKVESRLAARAWVTGENRGIIEVDAFPAHL